MGSDTKVTKHMEMRELPAFFRILADALERGGDAEFPDLGAFRKFKISGRHEFGQVSVKVRFKSAQECCSGDDDGVCGEPCVPGMPKYSHLKKRMKNSFRLIFKTIHDGQMPPAEAVKSFLADSELMITYPGYGDEYYAQYAEVCAAFRAAFESGDMDAMGATVDAIAHEKNRCHAKYD